MRPLFFSLLVSMNFIMSAWAAPPGEVVAVPLVLEQTGASEPFRLWVEGCGPRREVHLGVVTLHVDASLLPCRLVAWADHHAALAWRARRVPRVPARPLRLRLPPPQATPGFLLAPAPGGARVVPLDHAPVDPRAPHPLALGHLLAVRAEGVGLDGLDAADLHALVHGPPGSRLRLRACDAGDCRTLTFVRQAPVPWTSAGPPHALVQAWAQALSTTGPDAGSRAP